jgi:hypothetical protein
MHELGWCEEAGMRPPSAAPLEERCYTPLLVMCLEMYTQPLPFLSVASPPLYTVPPSWSHPLPDRDTTASVSLCFSLSLDRRRHFQQGHFCAAELHLTP